MEIGDIEGVKAMTYWEYSAAVQVRNEWHADPDAVEAPDADMVQASFAALAANPKLVN